MRRAGASYHGFTAANNAADLAMLAGYLASGQLVPVIERIVGFDGVAAAIEQLATGHGPGKIVMTP